MQGGIMRFNISGEMSRYEAASRHMQEQTLSFDKILVIGVIVLIILGLFLYSKKK